MKCIILAAGKGIRMLPLTKDKPKPLITINNRPFLHYVLQNLFKINIQEKDICIIVSYKKEMIQKWLKKTYPQITTITQQQPRGTGDAVKTAKPFVENDNFIMVNGDDLCDPRDIKKLLETDSKDKNMCYGIGYPNQDIRKYAAMITDENGFLRKIIEKPEQITDEIKNALANPNLWKFTPDVFNALDKIQLSPRGEYEITDAVQILADKQKMKIIQAEGYWEKLGCPEDVRIIEAFLRKQQKHS